MIWNCYWYIKQLLKSFLMVTGRKEPNHLPKYLDAFGKYCTLTFVFKYEMFPIYTPPQHLLLQFARQCSYAEGPVFESWPQHKI